jgi:glutamine synthetase
MEGEDVAQAPRNLLRRLIDDASAEGMHVKTGIEA